MVALEASPYCPWVVGSHKLHPSLLLPYLAWEVQAKQEAATERTYSAHKKKKKARHTIFYATAAWSTIIKTKYRVHKFHLIATCCATMSFSSFSLAFTSLSASSLCFTSSSTFPVYSRINYKDRSDKLEEYEGDREAQGGKRSHLQEVRKSKINHIVHPGQFKCNIWPYQIVTSEKAWSKAFLLSLQIESTKCHSVYSNTQQKESPSSIYLRGHTCGP